ncbi:hypothetical protein [Thioalkalivibrio sp. ALE30]|uniref:hypothetical protein n=1 Tax=Thioalkalivibrio sp. ALE30 TaxID=1158181 RepID=UPI00036E2E1D|nr:hypothetical protein [Thioalkalivibrio sp. ALE30]
MEETMYTRILNRTFALSAASVLAAAFLAPGQVAAQGAYFAPADGSPDEVTFEYRMREYGCANVRGQWRAANNTDDWLEVRVTKTAYNCPGELEDDVRTTTRLWRTLGPGETQERTRDNSVCGGAWARGVEVLEYEINVVDAPDES